MAIKRVSDPVITVPEHAWPIPAEYGSHALPTLQTAAELCGSSVRPSQVYLKYVPLSPAGMVPTASSQ